MSDKLNYKEKREAEVTSHRAISRIYDGLEEIEDAEEYTIAGFNNIFKIMDEDEEQRNAIIYGFVYILDHYGWTVFPPNGEEEEAQ